MRDLSAARREASKHLGELRAALGDGAVLDGEAALPFGGDESHLPPVPPAAVVLARRVMDVQRTLAWAHGHGIPVTPRGAGTGKAGGAIPSPGGIVLSLAAMDSITRWAPEHGWVEAEPGCITGTLRTEAGRRGLFYPPDPASLRSCTIGGNVATNAGGPFAMKHGVTRNFVLGAEAVLADGRTISVGRRQPKGVAGYDLCSLLVGSEGTLAVIVGVRLQLLARPVEEVGALFSFPSSRHAARALVAARGAGLGPTAAELIDASALRRARPHTPLHIPEPPGAWLLVELEGPEGFGERALHRLAEVFATHEGLVLPAFIGADRSALWSMRRDLSHLVKKGAAGFVSEDVAVPLGFVPDLLDAIDRIADRCRIIPAIYGHLGDGNLHVNLLWEDEGGERRTARAAEAVFSVAIALGGTITGEHGVGLAKRHVLPLETGPTALSLMRGIKAAWDPRGILNPGKVLV